MKCRNVSKSPTRRRSLGAIGLYLAMVLAGVLGWLAGGPLHEQAGLSQDRLDTAAPPLLPGRSVGQSFLAERPGLAWIEIYLVRYEDEADGPAQGTLTLSLEREDEASPPVLATYAIDALTHNQKLRFSFPPQSDSQGTRYRFTLTCDADAGFSAWYTGKEAYAPGTLLLDGEPHEGDLHFFVGYRYGLAKVLRDLGRQVERWWPAAAALLLGWVLPGWGILMLLPAGPDDDLWERLGLGAVLGACVWAVAFLWARVLGWRLGPWAGGLLAVGLALLGIAWRIRAGVGLGIRIQRDGSRWHDLVMALIVLATLATRLLHVRDLVLPAWVDSPHHVLMTQLLLEQGMVPRSALPYMPVEGLHYHFGFHASAAPLVWFSRLRAADAVLLAGQCWQMLAPLAAYTLSWRLWRNRWAAVSAAGLVGVWLYMPAYYTTWGRYPHLVGLILFCFAAGRVPDLLRGDRMGRSEMAVTALLSAGLGLAHFRILVLYVLWWLVALASVAWERRREPGWLRSLASKSGTVVLAVMALTLPWIVFVASQVLPSVGETYGGWVAQDGDNAFPLRYFEGVTTRVLLVLAALGGIWGLVRRTRETLPLIAWVALATLVSLPQVVGLPPSWLMSSSALAISFWVLVSILGGLLVGDLVGVARDAISERWELSTWQQGGAPVLAAAMTLAVGWGAWGMVDVVNPTTVLADVRDMDAMAWIRAETPESASFLVNARNWIPGISVGTDAGWWIPYLTGRRATQPPILYYQGPASYRNDVAAVVEQMAQWEQPDDAFETWVRQLGVTHIYVGSRGGPLTPRLLDGCSALEIVYSSGPVRIYQVLPKS
ncbi:MAG: DUF6541 family protein [Anaerolineae bacterium]